MIKNEIIIPVYNGQRYIKELLDSLSKQTSKNFFIVIADNGSSDDSIKIARTYTNKLNLQILDASQDPGKGAALNKAVHYSRSKNLLFIDQDDTVNSEYVQKMDDALERFPIVASCMDSRKHNSHFKILPRDIAIDQRMGAYEVKTASGGTIGLTREAFDDIGGFDANFNYSTNDVEFCWRAHQKGYNIQLVNGAILYYRLRNTIKENFKQGIYYGIGNYHIAKRHPEIRGDQTRLTTLILDICKLLLTFISKVDSKERSAHFIGKNIGQAKEKIRDLFN